MGNTEIPSQRAVLPTGMVLTLDAIPGRLCFAISVGACWDILERFFSSITLPSSLLGDLSALQLTHYLINMHYCHGVAAEGLHSIPFLPPRYHCVTATPIHCSLFLFWLRLGLGLASQGKRGGHNVTAQMRQPFVAHP